MEGWIKLYRQLREWKWYSDINTTRVFIHLLLTVNHKDRFCDGIFVKRGQRVASFATLSDETNLTVSEVRTALEHLLSTGEITKQITNRKTVITVEKYSFFQDKQEELDKQNSEINDEPIASYLQTDRKLFATNNNERNKEYINNNINNFINSDENFEKNEEAELLRKEMNDKVLKVQDYFRKRGVNWNVLH